MTLEEKILELPSQYIDNYPGRLLEYVTTSGETKEDFHIKEISFWEDTILPSIIDWAAMEHGCPSWAMGEVRIALENVFKVAEFSRILFNTNVKIDFIKVDYLQGSYSPFNTTHSLRPTAKDSKSNTETVDQKISRILKQLSPIAFDSDTHIDKIIDGFKAFRKDGKIPKPEKKVVRISMRQFILPFRELYDLKLFKRDQIAMLLVFYIKKDTNGDPEYAPDYFNRLLSEAKTAELSKSIKK